MLGSCGQVCRAAAAWSSLCLSYILNTFFFFFCLQEHSVSLTCFLVLCTLSLPKSENLDSLRHILLSSRSQYTEYDFTLNQSTLSFPSDRRLWFQVWLFASWSSCYLETRLHSLFLLVAYLCEFFFQSLAGSH